MSRPARGPVVTWPRAGPWFDHALVLTLLAGILIDLWLAAYLVCGALGLA